MAQVLKNLKIEKSVVFVTKETDDWVMRASNNIANVEVTNASVLNVFWITNLPPHEFFKFWGGKVRLFYNYSKCHPTFVVVL